MYYSKNYSPSVRKLGVVIGWLVGAPLLFLAIVMLFAGHSWWGELCFLLCAAMSIPPARVFLHEKANLAISFKMTAFSIAALLIVGMVLESSAAEEYARGKGAREYADKRDDLIELMTENIEKHRYQAVLDAGNPYSQYGDSEFKALLDTAKKEQDKLEIENLKKDYSENKITLFAKLQELIEAKSFKEAATLADKYSSVAETDYLELAKDAHAGLAAEQDAEKKKQEEAKLESERQAAAVQSAAFIKQVQDELANIKEPLILNNIESDVGVIATVAIFNDYSKLLQRAEGLKFDPDQKKILANFRSILIKRQKEALPKLRKAYGKVWHEKLWQEDCEAATFGGDNRIIEFRGNMFLPNKHKAEFMTKMTDSFNILRFSQVRFKWFKQQDEYTYYKLESVKDAEIGIWNEYGSFIPVKGV